MVTLVFMNSLWFLLTARLWVNNVIRSLKTGLEVGESCIFISINQRIWVVLLAMAGIWMVLVVMVFYFQTRMKTNKK